jgi:hypothetical protein
MSAKAFKILPKNYLEDWGEFEGWGAGTTSIPSGWVAATACTYSADTTNKKYGNYGLALIVGTQNGGGIYRTIPDGTDLIGRTMKLAFWAKAATTQPFILLDDGVSVSTAHLTQLNTWEEITITKKLDASATQIKVGVFSPQMGSTTYFDSGVLCEGENLFTNFDTNIDISTWQPVLNVKMDQYEVAEKEGSHIPEYHLQSNGIKIKGNVVGTDAVSCRTHFDAFTKALFAWQRKEKRNLYLYDDRVLEVFLKSFDWDYANCLNMIKFNMQFAAADPTLHYLGRIRNQQTITATSTEFNFVYNGNADSLPKIKVLADRSAIISTCNLQNLTTGEALSYGASIATASVLDIDCNIGTVKVDGVDQIANFSGDFLKLVRGTNYMKLVGTNCTIYIDYFERWF